MEQRRPARRHEPVEPVGPTLFHPYRPPSPFRASPLHREKGRGPPAALHFSAVIRVTSRSGRRRRPPYAEQGFGGATINEVERRVGLAVGKGSLYRHFPSKEALLEALLRPCWRRPSSGRSPGCGPRRRRPARSCRR
ncbi:TetR/AcrR family transcriptional regulator [Streptomyces sp. NBC_01515]|uniref:helix-turn-helix domain-containing protein n=1 Tax=Streptomyces sp. NBC_01515 TaxID=2903890 RepID=UPI003864242F